MVNTFYVPVSLSCLTLCFHRKCSLPLQKHHASILTCSLWCILFYFLFWPALTTLFACADMFLFKRSLSDSSRFGRTQPWTNDSGQVSLPHMPSSNARWQLPSALACLVTCRCGQPLYFKFPNISIPILPSGNGPQPATLTAMTSA
jgi:hypothetical protein